jgi:hypothetical protein
MIEQQEHDTLIKDEAPHDFYSQIPNMVDDYGLSPLAYRLYGHLRRVAGEKGKCWQNTKTLAVACNMSEGSISNAKKELTETPFIPFIRIKKVPTKTGFTYDEITITDLWRLNHDAYSSDEPVHVVNGSEYERLVHQVKQRISLLKNNPQKTERGNDSDIDAEIFKALSQITGGALNTDTPRLVDTWKEKHTLYWIIRAVAVAKDKGARSPKYVDEVLVSWEANGYPKSREDRVKEKRNGGRPPREADKQAGGGSYGFCSECGAIPCQCDEVES